MIVITGPGRSGTSVIALLYKELGFDPGGTWIPSVEAGLEDRHIVELNHAIINDLGMETLLRMGAGLRYRYPRLHELLRFTRLLLPRRAANLVSSRMVNYKVSDEVELLRWERFDEVVKKYGLVIRDKARSHEVVKDPRFCWTLMVWAASGARIDHVLVCIRSLDSMVKSRFLAGHMKTESIGKARNSLAYGIGLCMTALYTYSIRHHIVRFPDFLHDPQNLYEVLRFPRAVKYEQFLEVFHRVVDLDKVHVE